MLTNNQFASNDQRFHAAIQQHFQIAFETAALIMNIGEKRKIRRLIECVFDAPKHQGAVRIGHVKNHDSHGVAAFTAQRSRK